MFLSKLFFWKKCGSEIPYPPKFGYMSKREYLVNILIMPKRHFHFHSVVVGRLQDPPAGSNYGKKVKVPLRRVRGGSGV